MFYSRAIYDRFMVCTVQTATICLLSGFLTPILNFELNSLFSDEPDAESRCRNYLERAVESDPNSWEAWQTMASYCISAQRPEDAKSALERSMSQWLIGTYICYLSSESHSFRDTRRVSSKILNF